MIDPREAGRSPARGRFRLARNYFGNDTIRLGVFVQGIGAKKLIGQLHGRCARLKGPYHLALFQQYPGVKDFGNLKLTLDCRVREIVARRVKQIQGSLDMSSGLDRAAELKQVHAAQLILYESSIAELVRVHELRIWCALPNPDLLFKQLACPGHERERSSRVY